MNDEQQAKQIEQQWVGKKVLMVGDHPHADCVGVVKSLDLNLGAFLVDAINCSHLTSGWYVFKAKHWRVVK